MKVTAFGDVALCSLVNNDGRFRQDYCLHHKSQHPRRQSSTAPLFAAHNVFRFYFAFSFLDLADLSAFYQLNMSCSR
jgi:hypothetical protein